MAKIGPITGTFIDDITYDIPSSNWTREQWIKDFDNMQEIGIDTMIFIRGGFEDKAVFPSKVVGNSSLTDDFAAFVFEEASKRGMNVYFGLYISNLDWNHGDALGEIKKNRQFLPEVLSRYGDYPSFKGWYIPQEMSHNTLNFGEIMRGMGELCKELDPSRQVLISPFFHTHITSPDGGFTPEEHYEEWDKLFSYGGKCIDICAFQDGTSPLAMMDDYFGKTLELCNKYNIKHWVNAETFERDVRCMYYPIPFGMLRDRLENHKKYAEKIITFEFSHFLSPQSIYPSAQNLNRLYKDYYLK